MSILKNNWKILLVLLGILGLDILFQGQLNDFFDKIFNSHFQLDPYFYKILVDVGIAITLAVSLNLINGITGQFSLGHAGFMGIGAYVAASITVFFTQPWLQSMGLSTQTELVMAGISVGIAIVIGGICAAFAGLLVGIPTLRLKGDYLAIATLGFGEIIRIIIQNMEVVGGARGMKDIPSFSNFFWVYAWVVVCVVVVARLAYSVKGKAFFAIREDEFAASAIGIDTTRYKVIAFILGSFFAGVAGGLFAHSATGFISPPQFDMLKSIEIVVMVVLGGLGSISGAIIAAIVLTILPEALRLILSEIPQGSGPIWKFLGNFSQYRMVIYSLLLIIVMLTRPQGLMGMKELRWPWKPKPKVVEG